MIPGAAQVDDELRVSGRGLSRAAYLGKRSPARNELLQKGQEECLAEATEWRFEYHHRFESMRLDRFITLVGRGLENFRSYQHDRAALSSLYRTHRRVEEHGALLRHGNLDDIVW